MGQVSCLAFSIEMRHSSDNYSYNISASFSQLMQTSGIGLETNWNSVKKSSYNKRASKAKPANKRTKNIEWKTGEAQVNLMDHQQPKEPTW